MFQQWQICFKTSKNCDIIEGTQQSSIMERSRKVLKLPLCFKLKLSNTLYWNPTHNTKKDETLNCFQNWISEAFNPFWLLELFWLLLDRKLCYSGAAASNMCDKYPARALHSGPVGKNGHSLLHGKYFFKVRPRHRKRQS